MPIRVGLPIQKLIPPFSNRFIFILLNREIIAGNRWLSDADSPVFDPEGGYLIFLASTDAGPVINWFDQSSHDMRMTSSVYLATLRADILNLFARESDEEKGKSEEKGDEVKKEKSEKERKTKPTENPEDTVKNISIEFAWN